jgi:hypothetical protein
MNREMFRILLNHNQTLVEDRIVANHNQTLVEGRVAGNHNQTLLSTVRVAK